jgi:predicted RNA-binding Zn-ribbon protein involved in translation (DUF1610 family)
MRATFYILIITNQKEDYVVEQIHHQCPMCKGEFKPPDGTNPEEHLAKGILEVYRVFQEKCNGKEYLPCPRCGKTMLPELEYNAESRNTDIYICSDCGEDEAIREANQDALPIVNWYAVKEILR